jgi:hypothetical protein
MEMDMEKTTALPMFVGGWGLLGALGRWRKQRVALLAAAAMLLAAGPAMAGTVTGNYSATLSGGDATLVTNLPKTNFSLSDGTRVDFITVDPSACYSCIGHTETGNISVSFTNIKVNGVSDPGTFTWTGVYSATYTSFDGGVDSIVWTNATSGPFGVDQDGSTALGYVLAIGDGAVIDLIDGSDWNVQSYILADPATPVPAALPLFAGGLGMLGFLVGKRRRGLSSPIAA